jgi:hypothetical protein
MEKSSDREVLRDRGGSGLPRQPQASFVTGTMLNADGGFGA